MEENGCRVGGDEVRRYMGIFYMRAVVLVERSGARRSERDSFGTHATFKRWREGRVKWELEVCPSRSYLPYRKGRIRVKFMGARGWTEVGMKVSGITDEA